MDTSFVLARITDMPMAFCGVVCGVNRAMALEMLCEGCVLLNRSRTSRVHYSLYITVINAKRVDKTIRYISDELKIEGTIVNRFVEGYSHLCMRCLPTRLPLNCYCLFDAI